MLSSTDILKAMERGNISISDFDPDRLGPNSYDLLLGEWFFEVQWNTEGPLFVGPSRYESGQKVAIPKGGTLLGMTRDVIGTFGTVTAKMQARSTWGRAGITVCRDAGLGDIGYHNHWTLELTSYVQIGQPFITVGERIAQAIFFKTEAPPTTPYQGQYNYQDWPICMVPEQWRNRILKG